MPKLLLKSNNINIKDIQLDESPITIGRDTNNAIVIDDILVSRYHAKIFHDNNCYCIQDLKSGNGISVNDKKVIQKTLQNLDAISVGKYTLIFMDDHRSTIEAGEDDEYVTGEKTFVLPINRPEIMAVLARHKHPAEMNDAAVTGRIVMRSGQAYETPIDLTNTITIGGRSDTADIKLRGFFVGKKAFTIHKEAEGFFITHVEGKRMTKVNGSVVIGRRELQDGDLITIGVTKMKFSSKAG
jgi:pSer/pThr/pTyr-binding forkhead associated (FHA) protein